MPAFRQLHVFPRRTSYTPRRQLVQSRETYYIPILGLRHLVDHAFSEPFLLLLPDSRHRGTSRVIAYRYQPASAAAEIGGDWFDVIPLDRGQVALVVGDVTGHGINAAAIMGQLRTTIAALARQGCPPGPIMRQLSECDSVLASLAPRPRDDIALLLARTTTTPPPASAD